MLTIEQVRQAIADHSHDLASRGIKSLTLFGSVARNEATESSDVDFLVEFDRPTGLFGLLQLQDDLERILGRKVDLGTVGSLRPQARSRALEEGVRVA